MDSLKQEIDLYPQLPPTVNEFVEFKEITKAQSAEFNRMRLHLIDIFNDRFVLDATEHGVRRWEKMLKLQPKYGDSLEDRKTRIIAKKNNRLPYTLRALKRRLDSLYGVGNYRLRFDAEKYKLYVDVDIAGISFFSEMQDMLERIVPLNVEISTAMYLERSLNMNLFTGGIISTRNKIQIRPAVFKVPSIQQTKYYAGFISMRTRTIIKSEV